MFEKYKRSRNSDGTFKNDIKWTPWNDAWEYKMSDDLKDMVERHPETWNHIFDLVKQKEEISKKLEKAESSKEIDSLTKKYDELVQEQADQVY